MKSTDSRHWLSNKIRELRHSAGWSLQTMSEKTGMTVSALGSYERDRSSFSIARAEEILSHFGKKLAVVDETDPERKVRPISTRKEMIETLEEMAATFRLQLVKDQEDEE